MLADLDLLLIAVFCAADDLLPARPLNAKRTLTDAEVVTLCVAQSLMGHCSDERFLRVARKQLLHLFPRLPQRSGFHKRRERLSDTLEELIGVFASDSPGFHDDLVVVDSTPVECGRSVETSKRSQLADGGRLRLLRQPQPLLLRLPAAYAVRDGWHSPSTRSDVAEDRREAGLPGDGRAL
jgi:hypothetical protein